jgi:integrase
MRGTLKQRYGKKGAWTLIFDLGQEAVTDPTTGALVVDPVTGKTKQRRRQKWVTFRGTKTQAEARLADLLGEANGGTFVEPSKLTLIDWLRTWLEKSVKPPMRRPSTYRVYTSIIEGHIAVASIGSIPLPQLRSSDIERYLADLTGAAATITVHHAILHRALKRAIKDKLLTVNPATDIERRRPTKDKGKAAREHCWSALEAQRFIEAAKKAGPQMAAFCCLALDTGARKMELAGLKWTDLDLDAGTLTFERQLDQAGAKPVFGVTKTDRARTVQLDTETIALLRTHKQAQAELKMRNRTTYCDFGLVFAKEHEHLQTPQAALGQPIGTLGDLRWKRLVKAAGVKSIKFHGNRHTSVTLLLNDGVPVHVVAQRVGHANATMTLNVYAHALPSAQQDAAVRLGNVLYGRARSTRKKSGS